MKCSLFGSGTYFLLYPCGFLRLLPPTMLPSYFHLQLSYFQNYSSIIFHFHISHIPHLPSSRSFFRLFFSNVLSSGFPSLFLPISFQLSSLSVGHHIFPIRCHLFHSCHVHQLSNSKFSPCFFFFASLFSVSILPFHWLQISLPTLNTRRYLQNVVFPECSFNSKVFSHSSLICYSYSEYSEELTNSFNTTNKYFRHYYYVK